MTTTEDVWFLYEKRNDYADLIIFNKNECDKTEYDFDPSYICLIYSEIGNESPIYPEKIGNEFNKCNFKRKVYIKPGEECPICYEAINHKSNAYLTGCGHSFHKTCIFKHYEIRRQFNPNCSLYCPMCRSCLGLEIKDHLYRYRYTYINHLDNLENFWLKKELMYCDICHCNKDHYIGMKKDCDTCKEYIDGKLLFGL